MEVDKKTFFPHPRHDYFEQLPPPDIMWCQNDTQRPLTCPRAELDWRCWEFASSLLSPRQTSRTRQKVSRLEVNFSNHWPVHSSRVNCRTCSARRIRKRVQIKCKECDVGLCIGECFEAYHKKFKLWCIEKCWDASKPQNISPNRYVQKSCTYCAVSFAEWYTTAPECAKPRVWVLRRIGTGIYGSFVG
jgi:hypothetical protein